MEAVRRAADIKGVSAVVFEAPCIAVSKPAPLFVVQEETCIGCRKCIRELGCPAIVMHGKKAFIEPSLCYGCALCAQICPKTAIIREGGKADVQRDTRRSRRSRRRLASRLIAQAAMNNGHAARTAETIGMAQRGGCVVSHVRVGEEIHSPLVPKGGADLILGFEPAEAVRALPYLKPDGVVITSTKAIRPVTASLTGSDYDGTEAIAYLKAAPDFIPSTVTPFFEKQARPKS